ncbi:MAG: M48 family metallopeptidase [Chloroflexi bacterium]|nr:M48 family metallopeptidase [Chloroflexota bacterium]
MADQPDAARQEKAREYARIRHQLFFVDLGLGALLLLVVLVSGLSASFRSVLPASALLAVGLYAAAFVAIYSLVMAPLAVYGGYVLSKRYGLLTQSFLLWFLDALKGFGLTLVFAVTGLEVLYWLLERFPTIWWVLAAAAMLLFTVVLANLAPVLILPLFFKLTPVKDEALAKRLTDLASRAGTRVRGVFTMNMSAKGTAANAALMGLGNTRRIVLTDTLVDRYGGDEIEVVLAHELGHHVHGDIVKGIALQSVTTLVAFYLASLVLAWGVRAFGFAGIYDVAAFPLFALVVGAFAFATMPVTNAYSRRIETAADIYALDMTNNPLAFTSMMTKLVDQNLGEASPAAWVEFLLYDHPSYGKRVALAKNRLNH